MAPSYARCRAHLPSSALTKRCERSLTVTLFDRRSACSCACTITSQPSEQMCAHQYTPISSHAPTCVHIRCAHAVLCARHAHLLRRAAQLRLCVRRLTGLLPRRCQVAGHRKGALSDWHWAYLLLGMRRYDPLVRCAHARAAPARGPAQALRSPRPDQPPPSSLPGQPPKKSNSVRHGRGNTRVWGGGGILALPRPVAHATRNAAAAQRPGALGTSASRG